MRNLSVNKHLLLALLGLGNVVYAGSVFAEYKYNMTQGVTPISGEIYDLHMMVFWIVTAIGIGVFSVMIYSIINHRKSKGVKPAEFHESTEVEVLWTIIPFVILIFIAFPATKTLLALEDSSDADVTIKVTGYQWKWHYEYLDDDAKGLSFFSNLDAESNEARQLGANQDLSQVDHYLLNVDNPIVLPTNKKVRFLVTSNDVIHSWWVPALGVKQDAIPGYINDTWTYLKKPGVYRGQCTELCGKDHGFMPIVVLAKPENEYKEWLAQKQAEKKAAEEEAKGVWSLEKLMTKGEQVYNTSCAGCHQANGKGLPGMFPAIAGSKIALGPIADHINTVMNGKSGTAMQAFGAQLSDADLAAVITYERNAFGNNTGDAVQPSDIKSAR